MVERISRGGALGVETLNSATSLIQIQPRRLRDAEYVITWGWTFTRKRSATPAMEATVLKGWIYDHLKTHAAALKVAHPLTLRAIAAAKKKNDRINAHKIANCLRCDFCRSATWLPRRYERAAHAAVGICWSGGPSR
jgi:hypothetical protein